MMQLAIAPPTGERFVATRFRNSLRSSTTRTTCACTDGASFPVLDVAGWGSPVTRKRIQDGLSCTVTETSLGDGKKYRGKVRDTYDLGDTIVLVTTDRQSAFDRVLASVPFKGAVLNLTSKYWFEKTRHIVPNAVLGYPHANAVIAEKCTIFPVEFVVRGYMTGSTETSIWTQYSKGVRNFCGHTLPDGLVKSEKLPMGNLCTPTTKEEDHDQPVSAADVVALGLMTEKEWEFCERKALELFAFGQEQASKRGLILVDTKYEFGRSMRDGHIKVCDEMHTPDSSRYWIASSYYERVAEGNEPENVDKEFLRLWFRDNCDPYNDAVLPEAPMDLVAELSRRYVFLHDTITGTPFLFPGDTTSAAIERDVGAALQTLRKIN